MPRLDGSEEPFAYRGDYERKKKDDKDSDPAASEDADKKSKTPEKKQDDSKKKNEKKDDKAERKKFFHCGVGRESLAINPSGELKMCIHINYPNYRVLDTSVQNCWSRLKDLVDGIGPDENYKCSTCELLAYCRWCPARSWLKDGTFTSCPPASRSRAEEIRRKAKEEKISPKHIERCDE
jgi:radical SAM protein with 4Fe4S-binding SPASM domain